MKKEITATIITLNEEDNIAACIASAQKVCNEIIVVDSKSTDNTVKIAESLGAMVYVQEYLGDGPQKAYGVQFASNDWILSLDADERLDNKAVEVILELDLENTPYDAYVFGRKNFVGKHWFKAAGWYPNHVTRLYNKHTASYLPKRAHSSVKAKNTRRLNGHILHYTYRDITHWIDRINKLSSRDAWAMHEKGVKKPASLAPLLHALMAIVRKYILKLGILQGFDGITVTITTAFRTYTKYLKLIELHENNEDKGKRL